MGYSSQFVCVCVCPLVPAYIRRVFNKLNLPARSSLNSWGLQFADFAKTLLSRVIACFSFSQGQVGHLQFIEAEVHDKFVRQPVATWQVQGSYKLGYLWFGWKTKTLLFECAEILTKIKLRHPCKSHCAWLCRYHHIYSLYLSFLVHQSC